MSIEQKRRNYNRYRAQATPRNPASMEDVERAFESEATMKLYGFTKSTPPTRFYRGTVRTAEYGFAVFASQAVLDKLVDGQEQRLAGDGTFKCVKNSIFKQVYVIHVAIDNHVSKI